MYKLKSLLMTALSAVFLVCGVATAAYAIAEVNVAPGRTLKGPGVAMHSYDPVAFFTIGKPVLGSADHSTAHGGATYRFSSKEHLEMFEANPEKYIPAYGGYCAYGVAVGAKFDGDPRYWKIVDGKLYLNLNQKIQDTWLQDVDGNIKKANGVWKDIASKDPAALS